MGSGRIASPSSTRKPKLNNLGLIQLLGRTRASQGTAPPSRTVRELSHLCFRSEGASTRQAVGTQILIKSTRQAPTMSACLPGFPCPKILGYSRPCAFTWIGWTSTSSLRAEERLARTQAAILRHMSTEGTILRPPAAWGRHFKYGPGGEALYGETL